MYIRFCLVSLAKRVLMCIRFCLRFSVDKEIDMGHPCATNPELWFGYPDDDSGDGAAKARDFFHKAISQLYVVVWGTPIGLDSMSRLDW